MPSNEFWGIYTKREYTENGENREKWYKAGHMKVTKNGNKYMQLYHQPNVEYRVFPPKDDEATEDTMDGYKK